MADNVRWLVQISPANWNIEEQLPAMKEEANLSTADLNSYTVS